MFYWIDDISLLMTLTQILPELHETRVWKKWFFINNIF